MPHSLISTIASSDAIVDKGFDIYFTSTVSNSVTLTLPVITADGDSFIFRNIDVNLTSNTTTIAAGAGNTIEGQATYLLPTGSFNRFVALSTNWYLIG